MIHGIYSNKPSFKFVKFDKGLNVILAERDEDSDETKTVNSRGKSTLISIINFCLGSKGFNADKDSLTGWDFIIDITLLGERVRATRSLDKPQNIILDREIRNWPVSPELDNETGLYYLKLEKWKNLLGLALFDIPETSDISIRSLLSYFIRSNSGAYIDPLNFFARQTNGDAHIYNTFFVGLDPQHASEWVKLDKKDKTLKALNKAIKEGVEEGVHETQGELEVKKVALEEELEKNQNILSSFKVHEKYKEIQEKANQLTTDIHQFANQNVSNEQKLRHYEASIKEEKAPEKIKIEQIYDEAGVIFSDSIQKTLDDVSRFHETIVRNRKSFLKAEITLIENDIEKCSRHIKELTDERSKHMAILETHGALEEYSLLQERHSEAIGKLENIKAEIERIKDRNIKIKEIKLTKLELDKKANIDYEEKREYWEKAIRLFNETAKALYGEEEKGEFVINISDKGYKFSVDISGGGGDGIKKMKVFCYDLMIICMQSILKRNINFLIHDSTIYEGVDERQIAHAIEQAAKKSESNNFQYIMTINSDMVPYDDFSKNFKFDDYIKLRLTDNNISGSLLGIRF
ncbi:MAG: DUF2326 domain-containing protein [Endozoicomonadaceae bacterium]|nr:DUF2326 domain-containing protein [Endozoicomonadaceae bacterium]